MDRTKQKRSLRTARHHRVRRRVRGTRSRPRLAVFRSLQHIYVQLIDDDRDQGSVTLASASTREQEVREQLAYGGNVEAAQMVGQRIAGRALELGIKQVSFDRGGCRYHGRVKALAEAARKSGLEF